ncbi:helix-turn-helix domain-containing protein [Shuttleworthella satelles]|uniref:helix-turn-helix domain-containing protein n=1 Tax=Shuttleworthella satelles TaxID=177972 RepID=UPI003AB92941
MYRSTGRYYTDIVNTYRIDKARGLLQYSGKTIATITEECGYHTVYHFNRTFKKIMHMSAAEYRRRR